MLARLSKKALERCFSNAAEDKIKIATTVYNVNGEHFHYKGYHSFYQVKKILRLNALAIYVVFMSSCGTSVAGSKGNFIE